MPTLVKKLNNKKKSNNIKKGKGRRVSKETKEKPLNLNNRNNGSQAYKMVKRPQIKQIGPKEAHGYHKKWKASKNGSKEPKVRN